MRRDFVNEVKILELVLIFLVITNLDLTFLHITIDNQSANRFSGFYNPKNLNYFFISLQSKNYSIKVFEKSLPFYLSPYTDFTLPFYLNGITTIIMIVLENLFINTYLTGQNGMMDKAFFVYSIRYTETRLQQLFSVKCIFMFWSKMQQDFAIVLLYIFDTSGFESEQNSK